MSKLHDNPAQEIPKRILLLGVVFSVLIFLISFLLDFNFPRVTLFFWLATVANLVAFRIIVMVTKTMASSEEGQKKSMMPNLLLRYGIYLFVFILAWQLGDLPEIFATFVGVQMASISIKTDRFFTGGD